jgi:hypothetical protein
MSARQIMTPDLAAPVPVAARVVEAQELAPLSAGMGPEKPAEKKAETTEGTDAAPSTSVNTFDLLDGSSGTEFDKIERPRDRTYFTGEEFLVANKRAFVEGTFELVPPTAPGNAGSTGNAACEVVLFPSGMERTKSATNGTTIYTPISDDIPTVTADFYHAGTSGGPRVSISPRS